MTSSPTLNIIQTLPVDLWNIIIYYSDYSSICGFLLMCSIHNLFDKADLYWLKHKCIYDNIVRYSDLNRYIYTLYNKISSINTRSKYIVACAEIYSIKSFTNINEESYVHLRYSTYLLRDKLTKKIEGEKNKKKFLDITNKICEQVVTKDSTYYIVKKMIEGI
tara:strand:+ start:98 stop:586 length:489 start_codon:yes stop_codon:yes gene_type:complete